MPTLPEAVDSKYCDDDAVVTEVACIALQLKRNGRQRLSSVLILADCGIEEAGEEEEVEKRCSGVRELDLSKNRLRHWHEVIKILRCTPGLSFLNLSFNKFESSLSPSEQLELDCLTRLVLNGTELPWDDVVKLLRHTPKLEELHVCMNKYEKLPEVPVKYPTIRRLHFNNNTTRVWSEIEVLGATFPKLEALVLAECPISDLPKSKSYSATFPYLKYLSLNCTNICSWDSVYAVNDFPNLVELRLNNCPLYEMYSNSDRRSLTIASIWRIKTLNGGDPISSKEREDAERMFIRHYLQKKNKPDRYYELVALHGELTPLIDVSLKPMKEVSIKIIYGERIFMHTFNVYLKVLEVKKILEPMLGWPANKMRLFYEKDLGIESEKLEGVYPPEEIKLNTKQLYTFNVDTGDHFIVVEK